MGIKNKINKLLDKAGLVGTDVIVITHKGLTESSGTISMYSNTSEITENLMLDTLNTYLLGKKESSNNQEQEYNYDCECEYCEAEGEVLKVDELFKTLINGDLTACVVNNSKNKS